MPSVLVEFDEEQWRGLQAWAQRQGCTEAELIREAVQGRYPHVGTTEDRRKAFESIIGLWADRDDIGDTKEYIGGLRGRRMEDEEPA